jgi:hypothetical protein
MHKNGQQNDDGQWDADQPKQKPTSKSHNVLLDFSSAIFNVERQFLFQMPKHVRIRLWRHRPLVGE